MGSALGGDLVTVIGARIAAALVLAPAFAAGLVAFALRPCQGRLCGPFALGGRFALLLHFLCAVALFLLLALALAPSAVALWSGYRRHRRTTVIGGGIAALTLMALAIVLREQALISEHGESVLTLSGAGLLAATHWRNLRLHGNEDCCASGA